MGYYVTCGFCEETSKYRLECDCNDKRDDEILSTLKDCCIKDSFISRNLIPCDIYLYQKLCSPQTGIFYISICIQDSGEYGSGSNIIKITEEKYVDVQNLEYYIQQINKYPPPSKPILAHFESTNWGKKSLKKRSTSKEYNEGDYYDEYKKKFKKKLQMYKQQKKIWKKEHPDLIKLKNQVREYLWTS